MQAVKITE